MKNGNTGFPVGLSCLRCGKPFATEKKFYAHKCGQADLPLQVDPDARYDEGRSKKRPG